MKKQIIAAAVSGLLSGSAIADSCSQYYFGGDVGYNKVGYYTSLKNTVSAANATLKSKVASLGLLGGMYVGNNWGLEAGYTFLKNAKYNSATASNKLKFGTAHVDVLGYLPIERCFDVVGSVGLGHTRIKEVGSIDANGIADDKYNKFGYRLGAGLQYHIDSNFTARAMLGYQQVGKRNDIEFVKRVTSIKLGLTYNI